MKLAVLLLIPSIAFAWELPIVKVIDGDTIATQVPNMPIELHHYSIRVRGIDTPEKGGRAKCPEEAALAQRASLATKRLAMNAKTMTLSNCTHDKYGGRFVCDVKINGYDIGSKLIQEKLARSYDGGKKESWCK